MLKVILKAISPKPFTLPRKENRLLCLAFVSQICASFLHTVFYTLRSCIFPPQPFAILGEVVFFLLFLRNACAALIRNFTVLDVTKPLSIFNLDVTWQSIANGFEKEKDNRKSCFVTIYINSTDAAYLAKHKKRFELSEPL